MGCIGCEIKYEAANLDVEELIQEQLFLEHDLVAKKILKQRIKHCESCPFRSKHTCVKCGCFYRFRANLKHKACPDKRWDSVSDSTD